MEKAIKNPSRIKKSDFNPLKIHPFFMGIAVTGMLLSGYNIINAAKENKEKARFCSQCIALYMAAFGAAGYAAGVNHRYHKRTDKDITPPRLVDHAPAGHKIDPKFIKIVHNDVSTRR